jgi:hypothetical protein
MMIEVLCMRLQRRVINMLAPDNSHQLNAFRVAHLRPASQHLSGVKRKIVGATHFKQFLGKAGLTNSLEPIN